jgi:uncharacterized membrane protein YgaE (UPF0421/DUF939 family)
MITKNHEHGYLIYTINRVFDTSIGILIALLVNKYVEIPEKLKSMFKNDHEIIKESDEEIENEEK